MGKVGTMVLKKKEDMSGSVTLILISFEQKKVKLLQYFVERETSYCAFLPLQQPVADGKGS